LNIVLFDVVELVVQVFLGSWQPLDFQVAPAFKALAYLARRLVSLSMTSSWLTH
jgi:hypothetical protein